LDHKVLVLMIPSFQQDFQQMLLRVVLMLDHMELIVEAHPLPVYEVDLEMGQGMLFPETQVCLVLACLRLVQ
jgi:hypothetical protein